MSILRKIEESGVVGCGGAGFPTHRKLTGKIETFIVNGAECEPLLRTDRYLMRHKADLIVKAVAALGAELNIPHLVIALKHHYRAETAALRAAIAAQNAPVTLHELEGFYPAGDEQTIVYEVTGRAVPPGGIPMAVGAVVDNVATVYSMALAMEGYPFTQKFLTVTGEVRKPTVLKVPVGTSVSECIALAGGATCQNYTVVSGGPMMGRLLADPAREVVTKTTSALLVLPENSYHARTAQIDLTRMVRRAKSVCIQCTACTQLCPRHLLGHPLEPHRIMRTLAAGGDVSTLVENSAIQTASLCCECGICEVYACPMGLFPRKINHLLKDELRKAGIRPSFEGGAVSPLRDDRKAPTEKIAARSGVRKYYNYEIDTLITHVSDHVEIPLQMHIGAPSVPVVSVGDRVYHGALIARPPEGALGANIHASIDGRVTAIENGRIIIEKE